jgi:hypothetical protein
MELIQISDFSSFLFQNYPLFPLWKANQGLKLSRNFWTPENDHLHIYRLWKKNECICRVCTEVCCAEPSASSLGSITNHVSSMTQVPRKTGDVQYPGDVNSRVLARRQISYSRSRDLSALNISRSLSAAASAPFLERLYCP